jgi:SAM-dependent methyltransferase
MQTDFPLANCATNPGAKCTFASLGTFIDRSGKVGRIEVLRCTTCGHGISLPTIPDVAFLYEGRESQDYQPGTHGLAHTIKNIAFARQAKRLLKQVGDARKSILDFGCGSGQFTRVLAEQVPQSRVVASDFHPEAPDELSGIDYVDAETLPAYRGKFDLVLAMHVVEHEENADRLVRDLSSYLRPSGTLVVEVPNIDCVWARVFGKYWDAWYLPFHRHHFTRSSLIGVIERNGMKVEAVYRITVPTMGRTFANMAARPNDLIWLILGMLSHPIQLIGERLSSQPSAWRVLARRQL